MELKFIKDNCYYLSAAVNIGLIRHSRGALVIDTGLDKQTAKKIAREIERAKLNLTHILITHAHPDHFGGAQYLRSELGARVLATGFEAAILENPFYEPFYLFGGAYPIPDLCNKFLQGPAVEVDEHLKPGKLQIEDVELEIVPLPGHTIGQVGVKCGSVFYIADALFAPDILKKHGIPYFVDLDLTLKTLDFLEQNSGTEFYLPAHGELSERIFELTVPNRQYIYEIMDIVRTILPGSSQDIFSRVLKQMKITIENPGQYHLLRAAFLAYLSYLTNRGEVLCYVEGNKLRWKKNVHPDKFPAQRQEQPVY